MRKLNMILLILCLIFSPAVFAKKLHQRTKIKHVVTKTHHTPPREITTDQIVGFDDYPSNIKQLINNALSLSSQHLAYKFGSMDPENNGMDCSGTIGYLLKQARINDVPRQADQIYQWAWENGEFFAVNGHKLNSFEFSELKPGDLLFWTGTYPVKRDPAISHVMMYLGRDKENRPLMFGASTGRTFRGKSQDGVGVYTFNLPTGASKSRFLGYACIPGLTCGA